MVNDLLVLMYSKQGLLCLLLIIALMLFYYRRQKTQIQIKRWQKSLNLPQHDRVFQQLYKEVNGFILSRQARQKQDAIEYTYGEIEFLPFIALLSLANPSHETVFYDLGCGIGKAVLACAMVYPVHKSIGVELFPELYLSACNQGNRLTSIQKYNEKAAKIKFILGDFRDVDLNDATLIFINSSAFFGSIWENISTLLNNLPHLKTVITTSKPLVSSTFSVIISTKIQMSWGVVLAYIHTRKTNFH